MTWLLDLIADGERELVRLSDCEAAALEREHGAPIPRSILWPIDERRHRSAAPSTGGDGG
jgi:hypothetical protein